MVQLNQTHLAIKSAKYLAGLRMVSLFLEKASERYKGDKPQDLTSEDGFKVALISCTLFTKA